MKAFKTVLRVSVRLLIILTAQYALATGTINADDRYAFGANLGWTDWRADGASGFVFGEYVCSGYIYAANVGWIHLGAGAPANAIHYQNQSVWDYGVNHLGDGRLRGMAYGANIGWVTFEAWGDPRVDLLTGELSGYAYGANVGWISLHTAVSGLRTDSMTPGLDSDRDGIPNAWEVAHYEDKILADPAATASNGVMTVWEAYRAGLDPNDPDSALRIVQVDHDGTHTSVKWSSVPTRLYGLEYTDALSNQTVWTDSVFGVITPDAGPNTIRSILQPDATQQYYRVRAIVPLSL